MELSSQSQGRLNEVVQAIKQVLQQPSLSTLKDIYYKARKLLKFQDILISRNVNM